MNPTLTFDVLWLSKISFLTCAEQKKHLHAQVLVIGDLQSDELVADLQHLLALVIHERQVHALSEETRRTVMNRWKPQWIKNTSEAYVRYDAKLFPLSL